MRLTTEKTVLYIFCQVEAAIAVSPMRFLLRARPESGAFGAARENPEPKENTLGKNDRSSP
jgi:hypothetical protein